MTHFDTNFLIQIVVAGSPAHEKFRVWTQAREDCNASSIAWAEFLCGPLDAPAAAIARQIFPNPEPFLSADAVLAARLPALRSFRAKDGLDASSRFIGACSRYFSEFAVIREIRGLKSVFIRVHPPFPQSRRLHDCIGGH